MRCTLQKIITSLIYAHFTQCNTSTKHQSCQACTPDFASCYCLVHLKTDFCISVLLFHRRFPSFTQLNFAGQKMHHFSVNSCMNSCHKMVMLSIRKCSSFHTLTYDRVQVIFAWFEKRQKLRQLLGKDVLLCRDV